MFATSIWHLAVISVVYNVYIFGILFVSLFVSCTCLYVYIVFIFILMPFNIVIFVPVFCVILLCLSS